VKLCTGRAFAVQDVAAPENEPFGDAEAHAIQIRLRGRGDLNSLVVAIRDLQGVRSVRRLSR